MDSDEKQRAVSGNIADHSTTEYGFNFECEQFRFTSEFESAWEHENSEYQMSGKVPLTQYWGMSKHWYRKENAKTFNFA